jgi:hypothetical protein
MRDCTRCSQTFVLSVTVPVPDQPAATLNLCGRCDYDSGPAARAVIDYQRTPRDEPDDRDHMRLAIAWLAEVDERRGRLPTPRLDGGCDEGQADGHGLGLTGGADPDGESFARWEAELAAGRPTAEE